MQASDMASYNPSTSGPTRPEILRPGTSRTPQSRLPTRGTASTMPNTNHVPPMSSQPLRVESSTTDKPSAKVERTVRQNSTMPDLRGSKFQPASNASRLPPADSAWKSPTAKGKSPVIHNSRMDSTTSMNVQTPSLTSGSSISTNDSPHRNTLRRKPSTIENYAASAHGDQAVRILTPAGEGTLKSNDSNWQGSILGISVPSASPLSMSPEPMHRATPEMEFQPGTEALLNPKPHPVGHTAPPRTPGVPLSGSPSTRYSGSPGLFSHASTPTSMSSYSPGILSSKLAPRARTISPSQQNHPRVLRQKMTPDQSHGVTETQKLEAVHEVSNSSSSVSTERVRQTTKDVMGQLPPKESKDRPKVQTPPELAHLLHDPPLKQGPGRPEKPIRPSRNGTPTLGSREPSPIIQSNLSPYFNSYHKRQGSAGTNTPSGPANNSTDSIQSSNSDGTRSRLQISTNLSSRNPSPVTGPSLRSATPLNQRGNKFVKISTDAQIAKASRESGKPSAIPKADGFNKTSRFGFFSRRTKAENEAPLERPKREPRKGPMAGTGHEGYGRRPLRGRRVSVSSTDSVGRSPSTGSIAGSAEKSPSNRKSSFGSNNEEPPMDEFLSERLTPVFLGGESGSIKSDRISWDYQSNTSDQSTPQLSDGDSRRSSDDKPALTPKTRMRPFRSPSPLKDKLLRTRPPGPYVDNQKPATQINDVNKPDNDSAKAPTKSAKRWNFFQRTHNTSKKGQEIPTAEQHSHPPTSQTVPHYAMINDDPLDMEDIDRMMQDADGYSPVEELDYPPTQPISTPDLWSTPIELLGETHGKNEEAPVDEHTPAQNNRRQAHSILLPSPPMLNRPFSPGDRLVKVAIQPNRVQPNPVSKRETMPINNNKATLEPSALSMNTSVGATLPSEPLFLPEESPTSNSPGRPSRLAQIGRIPQVISKRDRDRKLPDQSFSRPFASGQPRPNAKRMSRAGPDDGLAIVSKDRRESVSVIQSPKRSGSEKEEASRAQATASATSICGADITNPPEFISFPPRHNSELSYTSSSGNGSFPGRPWVFSSPATAATTAEDVWNEYDDLIDDVISPANEPSSAKSALGAPFQYQIVPSVKDQTYATSGEAAPTATSDTSTSADPIRRVSTAPLTTAFLRQQRSSFLSALHSEGTRGSGLTELIKGYAERNVSLSEPKRDRLSLPPSTRPSSTATRFSLSPTIQSPTSSSHSRSATATEVDLPAPPTTKPFKRESNDMMEEANLRFGALMTSKWLSFGRVLFSPAHSEVKDGKDHRVLIIDGLGKDWSYYCALTYPKATVYNLGPTLSSSQTNAPDTWQSLPNHRYIHHASISSPFPFPRGFFSVAIFRFPIATSENAYRAALSECKRVLRPGGHLELSILDIDMLNMGNRARRAVRQLKVRMQATQRDVCLKPKSDSMIRSLGMRGYESINRCIVRVPAAGIVGSAASSPISSESGDKTVPNETATVQHEPKDKMNAGNDAEGKSQSRISEGSFGDIFKSNPDAKDSGIGITKMVARVGRWWWSSCYEKPFLSERDAAQSIWDDPTFLRECEAHGTGFKLLICYAQKPDMSVRRTVSV